MLHKPYFLVAGNQKDPSEDEDDSDAEYNLMVDSLPQMIYSLEELQMLKTIAEIFTDGVTLSLGVPFFLQIILKGIMSKLWLWINMMQLHNALTVLPV